MKKMQRFETLENEIRSLDQTIQAAERAESLERIQSGESSESEEQRALDDKKAFLSFVRGETRAMGVDTSSGGSLIPNTIAAENHRGSKRDLPHLQQGDYIQCRRRSDFPAV